ARVRNGPEGVMWRETVQLEPARSSITSDSMEISSWLPKETRSITEHLAIALREENIDSGYDPRDRLNPRLLSRRTPAPRAAVAAGLGGCGPAPNGRRQAARRFPRRCPHPADHNRRRARPLRRAYGHRGSRAEIAVPAPPALSGSRPAGAAAGRGRGTDAQRHRRRGRRPALPTGTRPRLGAARVGTRLRIPDPAAAAVHLRAPARLLPGQ